MPDSERPLQVRGRFPLRRYVMDLYVDIPPRRKVWLVDFSPWGPTTEPLLFDWSELRAELRASREEEEDPVLRVVRDQSECHGKLESFHQVGDRVIMLDRVGSR